MENMINLFKYDSSLDEVTITFYDKLPYERNLSVCGPDSIRMYSGNLIKSYACSQQESREVSNQDDKVFAMLKHQEELKQLQEEATAAQNTPEEEPSNEEEQVTNAQ